MSGVPFLSGSVMCRSLPVDCMDPTEIAACCPPLRQRPRGDAFDGGEGLLRVWYDDDRCRRRASFQCRQVFDDNFPTMLISSDPAGSMIPSIRVEDGTFKHSFPAYDPGMRFHTTFHAPCICGKW